LIQSELAIISYPLFLSLQLCVIKFIELSDRNEQVPKEDRIKKKNYNKLALFFYFFLLGLVEIDLYLPPLYH